MKGGPPSLPEQGETVKRGPPKPPRTGEKVIKRAILASQNRRKGVKRAILASQNRENRGIPTLVCLPPWYVAWYIPVCRSLPWSPVCTSPHIRSQMRTKGVRGWGNVTFSRGSSGSWEACFGPPERVKTGRNWQKRRSTPCIAPELSRL